MGAAALVTPRTADAAGWTQKQDAYYLKAGARLLTGNLAFNRAGEMVDTPDMTDISAQVYGEYGLTDNITLSLNATPFGRASATRSTSYVGPVTVGARHALYRSKTWNLAGQLAYGYVSGIGEEDIFEGGFASGPEPDAETGGPAKPTTRYLPTVETHRFDAELQAGRGFGRGNWVSFTLGSRFFAGGDLDPAVYASGQIGGKFWDHWVANFHAGLYETLGDIDQDNVAGTGETRYVGVGIGVTYWLTKHWGVGVGADGALTFDNNFAAPPVFVSVEHTGN